MTEENSLLPWIWTGSGANGTGGKRKQARKRDEEAESGEERQKQSHRRREIRRESLTGTHRIACTQRVGDPQTFSGKHSITNMFI